MNMLFNDSEMFTKTRPNKLTPAQSDRIYEKLATAIIDNNWCDADIDDIVTDLKKLYFSDTGFEIAKNLELFSKNSYDMNIDFIEWLEYIEIEFKNEITNNVKKWVIAHNITPKFEKHSKLLIENFIAKSPILKENNIIFINGFNEKEAKYYVYNVLNSKSNIILDYELIENNCKKIEINE